MRKRQPSARAKGQRRHLGAPSVPSPRARARGQRLPSKPIAPPPPSRPGRHRKGELTPKQQRFAREYAACGNGAEAARRAGYSARYADRIAVQLLAKNHVREEVQKRQLKVLQRAEVNADRVVQEWGFLSTSNIAEILDADGRVLPIQDLPEHVQAAIASVEFDDDGRVRKIRLWDKPAALRDMARYHKLLTPDRLNVNILHLSVTAENLRRMSATEILAHVHQLKAEFADLEAYYAGEAAREAQHVHATDER